MKIHSNNSFLYSLIAILFLAVPLTVSAAVFKELAKESPPSESPAAVYIAFLKAGSRGEVDKMRNVAHGFVLSLLNDDETGGKYVDRAKDVDWGKPVKWAQKIEGDTATVALSWYRKSDSRFYRSKVTMTNLDGTWKYGD